jgi:hypothetical protein
MLVLPLVLIIRENLLFKFIECLMYLVYSIDQIHQSFYESKM